MNALKALFPLALLVAQPALAQLKAFEDYDISEAVWTMVTVKVAPNYDDEYLEGLAKTWAETNELAKDLGHIEDFAIYRSELPLSGEFNLVLMVKFPNAAALEPSQEKYREFMEAWGEANAERSKEIVKDYPAMREITGEYRLRKIDLKD